MENGREGLLIPPFNHQMMADSIMELSIQPELCESFRNNSQAKIRSKFNYQNKVDEVIQLVNS